jgi:hypothetical protein
MSAPKGRPSGDVSSAPESGTVRDETSGNQPAHPQERGFAAKKGNSKDKPAKDDPSAAGEER